MNQEIQDQLSKIAFKKSEPFCYACYQVVKTKSGHCPTCGSDDNMRFLDGVGVEYGTSWIVDHILAEELTPVNIEEDFEQMIRECYPETTKVGWCEFDTVTLLKEQDPISWRCALSEHESNEESEGIILSFDGGSTYYRTDDVETFIHSEKS